MTTPIKIAPTEDQINEAATCLEELENASGSTMKTRDLQNLISGPGVLDTLCWPGAFDLGFLSLNKKDVIWGMLDEKRRDLLDGFITNLMNSETSIDELEGAINPTRLLKPGARAIYLKRLKQWRRDHLVRGGCDHELTTRITESIQDRIQSLIVFKNFLSTGYRKDHKLVSEALMDLAKFGGPTLARWGLNELVNFVWGRPRSDTVKTPELARRDGYMAAAFLQAGANVDALNETLATEMAERGVNPEESPNLLQQVLWWRWVSGTGPDGGQGEADPLVNALIDGGGDWKGAWKASSTCDTMRETLKQHPRVRMEIFADIATSNGVVHRTAQTPKM